MWFQISPDLVPNNKILHDVKTCEKRIPTSVLSNVCNIYATKHGNQGAGDVGRGTSVALAYKKTLCPIVALHKNILHEVESFNIVPDLLYFPV